MPLFGSKGNFFDYETNSLVIFHEPALNPIPAAYSHFLQSRFEKPDMLLLMKNELAKKWNFYKQDYYRHNLSRVCEMEELIQEWFDLSTDPRQVESRVLTLETYGFRDMIDQEPEFRIIISMFMDSNNLSLLNMQIGGTDLRVLKLELKAVKIGKQVYPLFDSTIEVKHKEGFLVNEVKRMGYLMDINYQPHLELRLGDTLTVYLHAF